MELSSTARPDSKKRAVVIAAAVCILVGLSFAVYALMPGDPVGTKFPGAPIVDPAAPAVPAKPQAQTGAAAPALPTAPEAPVKPKKTGFESFGK